MAYRNFNPGERDRNWRDPWRRERDYGDHPERYGEHRSRAGLRDDRNAYVWRGGRDEWRDDWSDDRYHARGLADAFGDFTMPDDGSMLRWSDVDEESLSASDWRRDRGDWLEDRYDARTARDTQRWRSDVLRYGGWGSLASAMGLGWGEFRGRGPRGYRRSDDRILEEVCEVLTDDPRIDASEIEVQVQNGEVTLSGMVSSRSERRGAEDLVEDIPGVRDVHNRLRANQPGWLERAAETLRPHSPETTRTGQGAGR